MELHRTVPLPQSHHLTPQHLHHHASNQPQLYSILFFFLIVDLPWSRLRSRDAEPRGAEGIAPGMWVFEGWGTGVGGGGGGGVGGEGGVGDGGVGGWVERGVGGVGVGWGMDGCWWGMIYGFG